MSFSDGLAESLEPFSQGPTFVTHILKILFRIPTETQVILTQFVLPS
jgi:hypothetical protein